MHLSAKGSRASVPEALKILVIIDFHGGQVEVKEIHRLVELAGKAGVCCKEYSFASYPWGPYSKDLEADLEILRASGLIQKINGGGQALVRISPTGSKLASSLEGILDPAELRNIRNLVFSQKKATGGGSADVKSTRS